MIPAQVDDASVSAAERRVFGMIENDPSTKDWTVLHSLGLARRPDGPYGEIDFVVVVPGVGVVCLEVKGGRLSCNDGVWRTKDRYGNTTRLKRSPFAQARSGMFALRDAIKTRFGDGSLESQCPVGCAVVFPDIACPSLGPEIERSDVIDIDDLRNPISKSILRLGRGRLREFRHERDEPLPTPPVARSIRQFLRPDFEVVVAKSVSIARTESKLLRLTEEQYSRLDELEANARCLFEGAAGTGKTLLAVEHGRRAGRVGLKVLLVCFNRLLGEWLRRETTDTSVTAGTWHAVARRFIVNSSAGPEFTELEREALDCGSEQALYEELYSLYGQAAMEEIGAPFDLLVVDEAQDLIDGNTLGFLDSTLRGGLATGRWAFFGDFTRQALYGRPVEPSHLLGRYGDQFVRARLTMNCRNTRRIAEETTLLAGFGSPPYRLPREAGLPVEHRYWKTRSDLVEGLGHLVAGLIEEGVQVESMVVLSPRRLENSSLAGVRRVADFALRDGSRGLAGLERNVLWFVTIHSFKGLESQVVILVDVDAVEGPMSQSLLYVAMSRARSLLVLMIDARVRHALETSMVKGLKRGANRD